MSPEDVDVLVVGLGPVGATLANLLGRHGLKVLAIDRAPDIFMAPRAIALDNEALRVLQACGIDDSQLDRVPIPEVRMYSPHHGLFARALTGGPQDGHPRLVTFHQPQLERCLRDHLRRLGSVALRLGWALESIDDTGPRPVALLRDGAGVPHPVRCQYVVGADGANSLVRKMLGLDFRGRTYAEDWLVVDARHVPCPIDHVEFICDPRRPTPHMVAPGGRQRWEFKLRPGETREQMERPDTVRRLLAPWTGDTEPEIERVAVYRFHARVADRFQRGRIFLVGDAAHITPPFVGQGLVAGLRDALNLAWKLAWVVRGRARPELLDTYDLERRPHAIRMIRVARLMGRLVMPSSAPMAWLVHGLMKAAGQVPRLRRLFENLEVKPANRFKAGSFVRGRGGAQLRRGQQLPQGWLRAPGAESPVLSDDALGPGYCLVGFGVDPRAGLSEELRARWQRLGGGFAMIQPRGVRTARAGLACWEDATGALLPQAAPPGWVAVVRPDQVVMHDGPVGEAGGLLQACLRRVEPQPPAGQEGGLGLSGLAGGRSR